MLQGPALSAGEVRGQEALGEQGGARTRRSMPDSLVRAGWRPRCLLRCQRWCSHHHEWHRRRLGGELHSARCRHIQSCLQLSNKKEEAREKAWRENHVFRAGASEVLVTLPIILHFMLSIVAPRRLLADAIASVVALGDMVHLKCFFKAGYVDAQTFADAIERYALAFLLAYPTFGVRPKSHGERKHQIIKLETEKQTHIQTERRNIETVKYRGEK